MSHRFFQQTAECFKSGSYAYQWGRCSYAWAILLPLSQGEEGSTRSSWDTDGGYNFSFSSRYSNITLDLHHFKSCMKAHPALVWQSFTQLFPSGYPKPLLEELSHIQISSFSDDIHSQQSLFDRQDNQAVFSPYRDALLPLWSPQATYIAALTGFQVLLIQAITLPNGVAMRAFQTAGLKFAAAANLPRNVYIDGSRCYIGKPEAKQRFRSTPWYHSYWGIHDQVGLAIILYLGIFRPLEVPAPSPATAPSTSAVRPYLFLTITPNVKGDVKEGWTATRWTGTEVNRALMHETSPLKAEGRVQRHFTKALCQRHLSVKIQQISSHMPLNDNLRNNDPRNAEVGRQRQLALSTAVQDMLGMSLPAGSEDQPQAYEKHGLELARHLVRLVYGLYGSDPALIRSKVETLQRKMPFFSGDTDENTRFCGDLVLVQTAAAVIYGSAKPVPMQPIPFNGYPVKLVAISLATVSCQYGS
jgi:hypothetical protein